MRSSVPGDIWVLAAYIFLSTSFLLCSFVTVLLTRAYYYQIKREREIRLLEQMMERSDDVD